MEALDKSPNNTKDAEALMAQMVKLKSKIEKIRTGKSLDSQNRFVAFVEDENKKRVVLK
jgi:hypothetical protein